MLVPPLSHQLLGPTAQHFKDLGDSLSSRLPVAARTALMQGVIYRSLCRIRPRRGMPWSTVRRDLQGPERLLLHHDSPLQRRPCPSLVTGQASPRPKPRPRHKPAWRRRVHPVAGLSGRYRRAGFLPAPTDQCAAPTGASHIPWRLRPWLGTPSRTWPEHRRRDRLRPELSRCATRCHVRFSLHLPQYRGRCEWRRPVAAPDTLA